jgi:hypothetical protein
MDVNESMNEWMDGWMDGWMGGLMKGRKECGIVWKKANK